MITKWNFHILRFHFNLAGCQGFRMETASASLVDELYWEREKGHVVLLILLFVVFVFVVCRGLVLIFKVKEDRPLASGAYSLKLIQWRQQREG